MNAVALHVVRQKLLLVLAMFGLILFGSFEITSANDMPIKNVSGIISENQTWTPDYVYVVAGQVNVPNGVTLTLEPGTIVKYVNGWGYNTLTVNSGGTLSATGTSTNPITFTSYRDDSVGGDSNSDGSSSSPATGDYSTAIQSDAGAASVSLNYTKLRYATTGLYIASGNTSIHNTEITDVDTAAQIPDGTVEFFEATVSNAQQGVIVGNALVKFRGTFSNVAGRHISACNWGSPTGCAVDAAYTDWGSSEGPFNSNPDYNKVCGAVSVGPWKHGSSTYNATDIYNVKNCDGSTLPSEQLDSSISAFNTAVGYKQIECSNGFQDACIAMQTAYACLSGAVNVAASTTPFPLPNANTATQVNAFSAGVRNSAVTYLNSQASPTSGMQGLSFLNSIVGVAGTMLTISEAYQSCAP